MKCGMMMMALCGVLAIASTGCKYNKAKSGAGGADDANANTTPSDITAIQGTDANGGSDGVPATGVGFDQNPNYKPVTDVVLQPVYFGFDSTVVPGEEIAKVEEAAKDLQANPSHVVIIEGNCDERGSNEYNLSLGQNRAIVVHDYLIKLGIAAERIQTKSYGEEKPAVQGHDEAAWAKNRRDEFALFQTK